jgi:heterodisulfide reductase subunit B
MNEYIFYPGCSMEGSAKAYYDSVNAIKGPLDMQLHEIDDWNCCGATEYVGMNLIPAYSLIARNLALAAKQTSGNKTIMAPCSAWSLNLEKRSPGRGRTALRAGFPRNPAFARRAGQRRGAGCY